MQETWVQSLGGEVSLEKGTAYPLQHSCLENSMDRGAWWATGQGGLKVSDRTEQLTLSLFTMHAWSVSLNSVPRKFLIVSLLLFTLYPSNMPQIG